MKTRAVSVACIPPASTTVRVTVELPGLIGVPGCQACRGAAIAEVPVEGIRSQTAGDGPGEHERARGGARTAPALAASGAPCRRA